MKTQNLFLFIIFFPIIIFAQDLSVNIMIGESQSNVIKKYGKPVHQDNSNPEMLCMFYQSKASRLIFVSNKSGVYQAEATGFFDEGKSAQKSLDEIIKNSLSNDFVADTISVSDYFLHKPGVKADLRMVENKVSHKYEILLKANKTESN